MNILKRIFPCLRREKRTVFTVSNNYIEWSVMEQQIYNLINESRSERSLSPLHSDRFIRAQAQIRTDYCISVQHVTHDHYGIIVRNARERGLETVSENLAYGYTTAGSTVEAFKNSAPHNSNMLKKDWKYIGVSNEKDEFLRNYYAVIFGK